jgi:hypothetical protein
LIHPRHDGGGAVELAAHVLIRRPLGDAMHTVHDAFDDRGSGGAMTPDAAQAPGQVGQLDVLTEEELIESLQS